MNAIELMKAERERQVSAEGWTSEHDDKHTGGELAKAAGCYYRHALYQAADLCTRAACANPPSDWPWLAHWWRPSPSPIRTATKAGALYVAEMDRTTRVVPSKFSSEAHEVAYTGFLSCVHLINSLATSKNSHVTVEITREHVERAAAAIANARIGRLGRGKTYTGPARIKNILNIIEEIDRAELIEDAEAALVAAFTKLP